MSNVSTPSRQFRSGEVLAWLLILGIIVFVVQRNATGDKGANTDLLTTATARFRALILIETVSLQKRLGATADKRIADQNLTAIRQIEKEAISPRDKFHAAVITGEVIGKDEALAALDRISPTGDAELSEDIAAARTVYVDGPHSLSAEKRERLVRRYGDFGKIILAFGVPPNEEPRKSIEGAATRVFLIASVIALGMLSAGVLSFVFCVTGIVLAFRGKLKPAFVSHASADAILLYAFAVYLVAFLSLGWLFRLFGLRSIAWNWLVVILVGALLVWIQKRQGAFGDSMRDLGLHRGRGWWREIGSGLMGYIAGLAIIVPGIIVAYFLIRYTSTPPAHPVVTPLLFGDRWTILSIYSVACIVAPVTEEMMFRGILFRHLRGRWNAIVSATIVGLIFAILHPQGWAATPALCGIAIVLAGIREWRDSLIGPIAAHAFNNFVAISLAVLLLRQ